MNTNKTVIIISELSREQLLTIPRLIKKDVYSFENGTGAVSGSDPVEHWTELPGLSRLVIGLKEERVALELYKYLKQAHPELKIHLSENILPKRKSFDASLVAPKSPTLSLYSEPEPIYQDDAHIYRPEKKLLVSSLKLDLKNLPQGNAATVSPESPSITLEQVDF